MDTKNIIIKIRKATTGPTCIKAFVDLTLPIEIDEEKTNISIMNCRIMTDNFNNDFNRLKFDLPQIRKNDGKYTYIVFINNSTIWKKIKTLVLDQYLNSSAKNKKGGEDRY